MANATMAVPMTTFLRLMSEIAGGLDLRLLTRTAQRVLVGLGASLLACRLAAAGCKRLELSLTKRRLHNRAAPFRTAPTCSACLLGKSRK